MEQFLSEVEPVFDSLPQEVGQPEWEWAKFRDGIPQASAKVLVTQAAPRKPWIGDKSMQLIEDKQAAFIRW